MKNYIKKIIVGVLSLAVLLTAQSTFAASIWNDASTDCPSLSIANFTTNAGFADPCWSISPINANPGETINVRVYYHNTSNVNATNTTVKVIAPTGSSTSHSFTAQITSPQGNLYSRAVTVNIPSSQSLTFGSARWYPNQTQTAASFINGQSGSEVISNGLNIGTIAPGWGTQGSVVVSFKVGSNDNNQLCQDPSASNYQGSLPCSYPTSQCTILNFNANPSSITSDESSELSWNTSGCVSASISNIGSVSVDGSRTVYPNSTTSYTLTARDSNGQTRTRTITVYVDNNNNNNSNCSINSFTASDTSISAYESVTLRWNTNGCDNVTITNIGSVSYDGSVNVYPSVTTTYILRASGNNSQSRSIRVNVNNVVNQPVSNNCAVTTIPTNVSQTGAQLNGIMTGSTGSNTYFEYGTSVNLGSRTSTRLASSNSNFTEMIYGLSPNTIYYFRMVSDCQNGTSRGAIEVFRTLSYTNTNTNTTHTNTNIIKEVVVNQGQTITGSASPLVLRIENRYQAIGVGDIIDYVVFYKNISDSVLTHPMVQVHIPAGLTLLNSSRGTYRAEDRILSAPIEDLFPGAEGVIYLQARVDVMDASLAQIVTTVVLVYTNPNGAQENAMAYVLNNPRVGNYLGASAFFGNIFGLGLIGWLILIIIILLLVLLARSFYNRRNTVVSTPTHTTTISQ